MKMQRVVCFALLFCLCAAVALAADVTGKWTASMPGRDGNTVQMTFTFKADGEKLTGTVSNPMGERQISDGKVNGDEISFVMVFNMGGNEAKMIYKGKVAGDEIKFTVQREGVDRTREFTAKKAS